MSQPTPQLLAQRAIRGGAILLAARLGMQAFSWAVTLAIPALVQPHDYGVMTWGFVFLYLLEIFAEAGLGRALVQREILSPLDRDYIFTLSLTFSASCYLVLFTCAEALALLVGEPAFATFIRVLGLVLWLVPFRTVALAILERDQRLGRLAGAHILTAGIQSALVLLLAFQNLGYWALAIGAITGITLEALSLWYFSGWWPRLAWPGREALPLLSFGAWTAAGSLVWFSYDNVDFLLIGALLGKDALGTYSLAFTLMTLPVQKLSANVNQVAYPVFCRLQKDPPRLADWYLRMTVMLGFVGVPVLAGMALVVDDAIASFYRPQWLAAVEPFRLLAVVGIVRLYASTLPPLYNALGLPRINFFYNLTCAIVLSCAFALGVWIQGVRGVCLAWLIVYPLLVAGLLSLTRSLLGFGLRGFVQPQLPVLAGALLMVVSVLLVRQLAEPGFFRLILSVVVGAVSYAAGMLLLGRSVVLQVRQLWFELRGRPTEETSATAAVHM
ncbi:MAG: lipopolysaccharide biosynthesis protein [Gemmataceae bacterium]